MRKIFSLAIFMAAFVSVQAQDIQLHYDLGHNLYDNLDNRPSVTTTLEMFKPDKWGSTYLFTDIDYKARQELIGKFPANSILPKTKNGLLMLNITGVRRQENCLMDIMEIASNMHFLRVERGIGLLTTFQKRSVCS